MPGFHHTLILVILLCDANSAVTFTHEAFIVCNKKGTSVLPGWREVTGSRILWIALLPGESNLPCMPNDAKQAIFVAYSAYDLPIVAALIRYFHAAAGYPVRSTWLKSMGAGNYSSWPGLTLANSTKYCPSDEAIIMVHLVPKSQGVRSTKPKHHPTNSPEEPMTQVRSNKLFLQVPPISKLYTDDTSRFPIHACSGNQYIIIPYHCDANLILALPFKIRKDTHRLIAYDKIMQILSNHKLTVDLQILDN